MALPATILIVHHDFDFDPEAAVKEIEQHPGMPTVNAVELPATNTRFVVQTREATDQRRLVNVTQPMPMAQAIAYLIEQTAVTNPKWTYAISPVLPENARSTR